MLGLSVFVGACGPAELTPVEQDAANESIRKEKKGLHKQIKADVDQRQGAALKGRGGRKGAAR